MVGISRTVREARLLAAIIKDQQLNINDKNNYRNNYSFNVNQHFLPDTQEI